MAVDFFLAGRPRVTLLLSTVRQETDCDKRGLLARFLGHEIGMHDRILPQLGVLMDMMTGHEPYIFYQI